jgi:hypothetical protein
MHRVARYLHSISTLIEGDQAVRDPILNNNEQISTFILVVLLNDDGIHIDYQYLLSNANLLVVIVVVSIIGSSVATKEQY